MTTTLTNEIKAHEVLVFGLLAALLLMPGAAHFINTGALSQYFTYHVLDGQFLYVLSKFLGLYAFVLFWLQLLGGSYRSPLTGVGGSQSHRGLGALVLVLILLHAGLFVTGVSIRNQHFAYQWLLPDLFTTYYPRIVSLGLIALVLLLVSIGMAVWRARRGNAWRMGHWLVWVAFGLAFVHSYTIGSEAKL
ncbi:MAG: ferric reductase-like transmembrane domain-containing protein, partial [Gammaproteobacteria bacterium]|nr:ferric reductase-like transmembrane domain-containing protein [Gammaproteobacteria bacterium]